MVAATIVIAIMRTDAIAASNRWMDYEKMKQGF